ncbi:uncharacterized protein LOC108915302 [Anoplophora glabripennis]|uniref:uncharacterized protein LOC108915302 n=1 Tax=Anoplophora glabripennis TaxID=217634 RepID=UPI000C771EE6|nr:uncharacterized protein LOC108915302 [Anoplophora glabripennis]
MRRETRSTLMHLKRQIDNMTPPEPSKIMKQTLERKDIKKSNERYDLLQKWKMEKEKRKLEEKQKAKPVFKVCRVPDEISLSNLDVVNKNMKGKLIEENVMQSLNKFAPSNHTFHPPKALKPIHINSANNCIQLDKPQVDLFKINTFSNSLKKNKHSSRVTGREGSVSRTNTRATTPNRRLEKFEMNNKSPRNKLDENKNNFTPTSIKQKTTNSKIENKNVKPKAKSTTLPCIKVESKSISATAAKRSLGRSSVIEKKISNNYNRNENFVEEHSENKSLKLSRKPVVKTFEWNYEEVIGDQGLSAGNKSIKTPTAVTKKYNKTPRKTHKLHLSDVELINFCNSATRKKSDPQSIPKNIMEVRRRLRNNNPNSELKGLDKFDQIESDSKSRNCTVGSATGSAPPDYPIDKNLTDLNSCFHTPQKNNICEDSPVYISPFVTVSREKSSARKEYHMRYFGVERSPEFGVDILNSTSPKAGADYFLKKLNSEVNRIEITCDMWENYKNSNELSEEANDMINVAIGQSKLLISKKIEQFRSLIE